MPRTALLSIGSMWEIAIKVSLGKLDLPSPFEPFMIRQLEANNITIHPIRIEHTGLLTTLPFHHRDPFDRLIIAQALTDHLSIIGKDPLFDLYGVKRIW